MGRYEMPTSLSRFEGARAASPPLEIRQLPLKTKQPLPGVPKSGCLSTLTLGSAEGDYWNGDQNSGGATSAKADLVVGGTLGSVSTAKVPKELPKRSVPVLLYSAEPVFR